VPVGWRFSRAEARRASDAQDPFAPGFLARLDRARLRVVGASGDRPGETPVRGRSQGSGVELESYKTYTPGDDIRHVDWIALGRTDQLLTRRFVAEREIAVHILVDASASMGTPAVDGKLAYALRFAVALAYVALNNNDSVRLGIVRGIGASGRLDESRLLRHRGRFLELRALLDDVTAEGSSPLAAAIAIYLERHREKGLVFLVSDFLAEQSEVERALTSLRERGLESRAIHVLGHEERELASARGRLRLRDVETGNAREVVLSEADRRRYREAFDARSEELRRWCHRHGIGYLAASTAEGVERLIVHRMAAEGLVRFR
jgi:uncharacterized protein (DUF58 family)